MTFQSYDPQSFLETTWQRSPARFEGLFKDWQDFMSPEELAGLACEDGIESRLVVQDQDGVYRVSHGPLEAAQFQTLPAEGYSLLVHGLERIVDGIESLKDPFRGIPGWRFDDIMASYAPKGGGVGAHKDLYDVFLVQGMGKRRWRYNREPIANPVKDDSGDLALLRDVEWQEEWVMSPGDVLYLPAGVPHEGVSLEPSMTYSIGFRSPAIQEFFPEVAVAISERIGADRLLKNHQEGRDGRPHCLDGAVDSIVELLVQQIKDNPDELLKTLGEKVTSPRMQFSERLEDPLSFEGFCEVYRGHSTLAKAPGLRLAYSHIAQALFVEGEAYPVTGIEELKWAQSLCADHQLRQETVPAGLFQGKYLEVFHAWYQRQYFDFYQSP